jgi:hypothetical protein
MLSNQEKSTILNKNAFLRLFAYSPKSRGDHLLLGHPVTFSGPEILKQNTQACYLRDSQPLAHAFA